MKKIVVANLKMYMDSKETASYLNDIDNRVIYCPSSIFIPYFITKKLEVGIQNICSKESGAYTGEISAKQAHSMGVKYVIVGHSERRNLFNDYDIKEKIHKCLENNLKVILCIGEKKDEDFYIKIKEQLLDLEDIKDYENIIIAYEPVWAIGSGLIPTVSELETRIKFIKDIIKTKVLYGGSVDKNNIATLNEISLIDGYLVGSASTKKDELKNILEVVDCQ